ncbi:Membrane transporter [Schizosaccharomyces pombe]|uniref:Uncharacterized membrane protein C6F6.04c n=1 Tax=Schizosaccharomyces pombe (strain 972 / ATCC 24843) TaxID=284812 RepID=YEL4_SCHPO|nr:putative transporter [Schizosaccharomyces pombe]O14237.1 RecName: Full=Uncharacterized membrane protein C6F6.04c [Schizosaccharomyces pombe 972h-]CAB11728.1 membrane transporter (predicted) [Schizosaccharomyces pombe]|eukprot:NP_593897.1 putative transporter [Schizosaccharomyces pombe]
MVALVNNMRKITIPSVGGKLVSSGQFQNFIASCILFCCPGIYLAVTGLGAGGGHPDAYHMADVTNSLLYALFTVCGWAGGPILKYLGPRWALALGATGYPIYIGGLWYFDNTGKQGFTIFTGAYEGIAAGLLWASTAYISLSYSCANQKSQFIATQWTILAFGSTVGSFIAFGINYHSTSTGVPMAVYIIFIIIMACAVLLAILFIKSPSDVRKSDGTSALSPSNKTFGQELWGLFEAAKDWRLLCLLPASFASQSTIAWQSHLNSYYFSLRTRSLNNVLFWVIQFFVPYLFTLILDAKALKRRTRGIIGLTIQAVVIMATLSGELGWIVSKHIDLHDTSPDLDWTQRGYGGALVLYLLMGIQYGSSIVSVQWCISLLSSDPDKYARYAGLYKGTQAAGMCVSFGIDAAGVSFLGQGIIYFIFLFVMCASQLIMTSIFGKETDRLSTKEHFTDDKSYIDGVMPSTDTYMNEKTSDELDKKSLPSDQVYV